MSVLLQATLLALLVAAVSAQGAGVNLGPTYTLQNIIQVTPDNSFDRQAKNFSATRQTATAAFSEVKYFEWESYDGWFNNPAHPEWGGAGKPYNCVASLATFMHCNGCTSFFSFSLFADMPLERKTPVVYPDGVYEIVREESRGNVLLISNLTQHGLSGLGSVRRTAFFTFFGKFCKMPTFLHVEHTRLASLLPWPLKTAHA